MSGPEGERCGTCVSFMSHSDLGMCRRFPPTNGGLKDTPPFPITPANSWCAEHMTVEEYQLMKAFRCGDFVDDEDD